MDSQYSEHIIKKREGLTIELKNAINKLPANLFENKNPSTSKKELAKILEIVEEGGRYHLNKLKLSVLLGKEVFLKTAEWFILS